MSLYNPYIALYNPYRTPTEPLHSPYITPKLYKGLSWEKELDMQQLVTSGVLEFSDVPDLSGMRAGTRTVQPVAGFMGFLR